MVAQDLLRYVRNGIHQSQCLMLPAVSEITIAGVQKTGFTRAYDSKRAYNYRRPKVRNSEAKCSNPTKRRGNEYSVTKDVQLGNRGNHFVSFMENHGWCEVHSKKKIQSRPHSKCTTCRVFLCCNEKKNCFSEYHSVSLE
jgi:hypothetical protein